MLMLGRKSGQSVVLYAGGQRIVVTVYARGAGLQVGIEADREAVRVVRSELEATESPDERRAA